VLNIQAHMFGVKGEKVEFIQSDKTNSVLVPKVSVKKVILSNGEIVNFSDVASQSVVQSSNQQVINNNPNDRLTTVEGKVYNGKYTSNKDGNIHFTPIGNAFPMLVPEQSVKNVVLSNGTVVFGQVAENMTDGISGYNPCEDERYLEIKDKPLNEMTDREYNYFLSADKDCKEYKSTTKQYSGIINSNQPRVISSSQTGAPSMISQTAGGSMTEQLKLLAYDDATNDIAKNNPNSKWVGFGFIASALLSPLLGGTGAYMAAGDSKPDTQISGLKTVELQKKYNNDANAIAIYNGYYKDKKIELHKKAAKDGAAAGCVGGFILNLLILNSI